MTFSLPELYERRGVPRETARAAKLTRSAA